MTEEDRSHVPYTSKSWFSLLVGCALVLGVTAVLLGRQFPRYENQIIDAARLLFAATAGLTCGLLYPASRPDTRNAMRVGGLCGLICPLLRPLYDAVHGDTRYLGIALGSTVVLVVAFGIGLAIARRRVRHAGEET